MKEYLKVASDKVKEFNRKPPIWFYVVAGVVIIIFFQLIKHI